MPLSPNWLLAGMVPEALDILVPMDGQIVIAEVAIPPDARHLLGCLKYADVFNRVRCMWFRHDLRDGFWRYAGGQVWNRTEEMGEETQ